MYFGSDNWNALFSLTKPQNFKDSYNPFGCGISACIVTSNVFRYVFKDFLKEKAIDEELIFSTINYSTIDTKYNPDITNVTLSDVALVGIGAIGNGCIWALSNLKGSVTRCLLPFLIVRAVSAPPSDKSRPAVLKFSERCLIPKVFL